jgi:hypothetical protein
MPISVSTEPDAVASSSTEAYVADMAGEERGVRMPVAVVN